MKKRLTRFFRPTPPRGPAREGEGLYCSIAELVELRHLARALTLGGRRPAASILAGNALSRFRGRGMDYSESRIYTPGDDIRHIDWRVTARTGKLHTKLYTEERDRPVIPVVAFSPTLYFGTRKAFKSVVAARLAALVGWSAAAGGDRVGGLLSAPGQDYELRPRAGRQGVLRLVQALAEASRRFPDRDNDGVGLEKLLHQARRSLRPGSRIFLIGDFFDLYPDLKADLARLSRHSDLILCQLVDPFELEPPPPGRYRISDGRHFALLDSGSREALKTWREKFQARRDKITEIAAALQLPRVEILTSSELTGFFADLRRQQPKNGRGRAA